MADTIVRVVDGRAVVTVAGSELIGPLVAQAVEALAGAGGASPEARAGTSYTLLAADLGKVLTFDSATLVTVTVPPGLGANFNVELYQKGVGLVEIAGGSGVAFVGPYRRTETQYSSMLLRYSGTTDTYFVQGQVIP